MRRFSWISRGARLSSLLLLLFCGRALAATQSLTILHDNDIHGHLRAFCYVETARGPEEHCNIGGGARRATLIRTLKAKAPDPVRLIDSGDTTTRGPLATEYEGADEIAVMNAIGYDMAAIGNNEFKLKDAADAHDAAGAQAALGKLIRQAHFPWLCANVTDAAGAQLSGVHPFIVRKIGAIRVAFLGLTAQRSAGYPQTMGLVFTDPVAAAKIWIPRARVDADIVIAVTHIGVADDLRLVRETRGLDAVVGGDSHTYLYKLAEAKNLDGVITPIVQDGEFGARLGKFDLTFEGDAASGWRLTHYADQLIPVEASIQPDPKIDVLVERYARPLDVPVGTISAVGATPAARTRMTADALAQAWRAATGADVGLQPEGVLFESFRSLSVTRYQVRAIVPFHDLVWRGQTTGARLKDLLAKPSALGGVMHATISPADIDPAKIYSVGTTDFVAQAVLPGATSTGQDARTALEHWLAGTSKR